VYLGTTTGLLHILDGSTDTLITSLTIGTPGIFGERFRSVEVSEQTGRIFVCDHGTDLVTVIDANTNSVITTIGVGQGPTAISLNELTNRVYVGNQDDSSISFIDGDSLAVTSTLSLPLAAKSVDSDPAVSRIYLSTRSLASEDGIAIISDLPGTFEALRK